MCIHRGRELINKNELIKNIALFDKERYRKFKRFGLTGYIEIKNTLK